MQLEVYCTVELVCWRQKKKDHKEEIWYILWSLVVFFFFFKKTFGLDLMTFRGGLSQQATGTAATGPILWEALTTHGPNNQQTRGGLLLPLPYTWLIQASGGHLQ